MEKILFLKNYLHATDIMILTKQIIFWSEVGRFFFIFFRHKNRNWWQEKPVESRKLGLWSESLFFWVLNFGGQSDFLGFVFWISVVVFSCWFSLFFFFCGFGFLVETKVWLFLRFLASLAIHVSISLWTCFMCGKNLFSEILWERNWSFIFSIWQFFNKRIAVKV